MKTSLFLIAVLAAAIYIALCGFFYSQQDRMLYPGAANSNPAGFKSLRVQSGSALLKVWELHPSAHSALLYFGGNAEDLGTSLSDFDEAFPDRAIYLMTYRGYGGSNGTPSEAALIADAQATYDAIRHKHDQIAVMGRSLGTGVAVALAATRDVEKVVLVTPYDSMTNVAAKLWPWMPVRWLMKDNYDSVKRMSGVRAPVLAVIAEHDEIVARSHSDALVMAIPEALRHSIVIPGGTHNDLGDYQQYLAIVRRFLAE